MRNFLVIILTLLFISCGSSHKTETLEAADLVLLQDASSLIINNFMGDLKGELMSAVKVGGFKNGINVCKVEAPKIAAKHLTQYWSMKRVTDKPRNELNTANEHELQILALFADSLKKLTFFDEWKSAENKKDYYFYKPIYMGKLCLKCHGTTDNLDQNTLTTLQDKYPNDIAIGYKDGDLRGMFVVRFNTMDSGDSLRQILMEVLKSKE